MQPGRYDCRECEADVEVMHELGDCGGEIPDAFSAENPHGSRLHLMVGEGVTRCPIATADAETREWAELVPSPYGPGMLDGIPPLSMPPRYRALIEMARVWLEALKAKQRAPGGVNA